MGMRCTRTDLIMDAQRDVLVASRVVGWVEISRWPRDDAAASHTRQLF